LRLALVRAQKDVAPDGGDLQPRRDLFQAFAIRHYPTTAAGLLSSPISATRMETTSPGASAASLVTMIPVPVSSTVPAGTLLARVRYSTSVSGFRCRRAIEIDPANRSTPSRVMRHVISSAD